ncbi:MAG: ATP-dependent Clp protease ATP-binding subunit [Gammaproteobacteria bacterium]|nr:MAG: ATP-dependent Clp protease ATP-binding subunit [Gammaproteobacteria bacterium]
MSNVYLTFPALVVRRDSDYRIRPLLFEGVDVSKPRYATALQLFRKEFRDVVRMTSVSRSNYAELLWYGFNPKIKFKILDVSFKSGKRWVDGRYASASFELNGFKYVVFPELRHTALILEKPKDKQYTDNQIAQFLQEFFRKEKEEAGEIDHELYQSKPDDSFVEIRLNLQVKHEKFSFIPQTFDFYDSVSLFEEMDGYTELTAVAKNLNELYPDQLLKSIGRTKLIKRIEQSLYADSGKSVVLVGATGVGKTSMIHGSVASRLQSIPSDKQHQAARVWHIDPLRVISGMSVVGMWQRRMEKIIEHLRFRQKKKGGKYISDKLFIDNLVALFRIGKSSQNSLTLASVLKPYLERRTLTVIGEATPEEWQKVQELDRRFADLFEVYRIDEMSADEVMNATTWQRGELEERYSCEMTRSAIAGLWQFLPRLALGRKLPGAIIDPMKLLCAKHQDKKIEAEDIYRFYQNQNHFSQRFVNDDILLDQESIDQELNSGLIGQPLAKQVMSDTLHRIKSRLNDPRRPFASFLFIGPTGVGKTEAAKVLTRILFDNDKYLIRFDMNEFIDADALSRLIGSFQQPEGLLTSRVRQQRTGVLLLDEIEKAHPSVHDLLLQVIGEGRLTDAAGRTTDFTQCVIIMTSNLGAKEATSQTGFIQGSDQASSYRQAVERFFRPEFVNRIDHVVAFDSLTEEQIIDISYLMINKLLSRDGFVRRLTFLNVDQQALKKLVHDAFEPAMGARALKRNLEQALTRLAAMQMVEIPSDVPIVIDIELKQGQIASTVTEMVYAQLGKQNLPVIDTDLAVAFSGFFAQIESAEEEINRQIDDAESDIKSQLWIIQDSIRQVKQRISGIVWDIQQWQSRGATASFKLKPGRGKHRLPKRLPVNNQDLIAQSEMRDYMLQLYEQAADIVDIDQQFYMESYLEFALGRYHFRALVDEGEQQVSLLLKLLVSHKGEGCIKFLSDFYRHCCNQMEYAVEINQNEGECELQISGAGARTFFEKEIGVHLYSEPDGSSVPLQVELDQSEMDKPGSAEQYQILRVYGMSAAPDLKDGMVSDLRTGLLMPTNELFHNWRMIFYPALSLFMEQ